MTLFHGARLHGAMVLLHGAPTPSAMVISNMDGRPALFMASRGRAACFSTMAPSIMAPWSECCLSGWATGRHPHLRSPPTLSSSSSPSTPSLPHTSRTPFSLKCLQIGGISLWISTLPSIPQGNLTRSTQFCPIKILIFGCLVDIFKPLKLKLEEIL
jgi:hypothetical protein